VSLSDLWGRNARFVFCGGKGGVGKTIISAAIGLWTARHGEKTLIFSTDPAHSLSDAFDVKIGNRLTQIDEAGNLYGFEISSQKVFEDLKERYRDVIEKALNQFLRGRLDLPFERQLLRDIMDFSPPGLDELMALSKLSDILTDYEFDRFVIDTAAGAHAIRLIELPGIVDEWLKTAFRLVKKFKNVMSLDEVCLLLLEQRSKLKRLRESVLNPKQAVLVAITIPEALGISVVELMIKGFKFCGIPCQDIIVNFVVLSDVKCNYCILRRRGQIKRIKEIREKFPRYNILEIPQFPQQVVGIKSLDNFAKVLFGGGCKPKFSFVRAEISKSIQHGIAETPRLELQDKSLVLFGGKGGCGKTTCSAATGIYMGSHGKKTLVLSTDPQHSLSDSFDQEVGYEITPIKGINNLYAMEIDAEKLLKEWREENREALIEIAENATYMEREDISQFLDLSLPGMDELMAQRELQRLIKKAEYDLYILDTAPTGHALCFLGLPDVMSKWVKVLVQMHSKTRYVLQTFFGRRAQRLRRKPEIFLEQTMRDIEIIKAILKSRNTEFIPVTILEEMAIKESERLLNTLTSYKMQVRQIVCNGINPHNPDCPYCTSKRETQQKELQNVREKFAPYKIVEMPLFPHEIRGIEDLSDFGKVLFEGVSKFDP
jgi:arsenite-transporting ATPase